MNALAANKDETLSEEWQRSSLGDVCTLIKRGVAPKYTEQGGIPVINQKCIRDHEIDMSLARRHDLDKKRVPEERFVQLGDVLVNSTGTGTLGRVAQVRKTPVEPTTVDTHVTIVRPESGKFYLPFFGYTLITIEQALIAAGQGAVGQTELPRKDLSEKFEIAFASDIDEQKRIVAVLDQAFAALDRARELVKANISDTQSLEHRVRETELDDSGKNWVQTTIGDICDRFEYGTSAKSEREGAVPVLRMGNIKNGEIDWNDLKYSDDSNDITKYSLKNGDVLFNRTNSIEHVGKTAIYRGERQAIFAGYLIRLHYKRDQVHPDYLNIFLNSDRAKAHGHGLMGKSVNQANISASKLKTYPIALPSLAEQQSIADKMHSAGKLSRKLHDETNAKLANIDGLRQSILHKAFAGELI